MWNVMACQLQIWFHNHYTTTQDNQYASMQADYYEWMNEKKNIYIADLKAYKCMLNLPCLAEN